MLWTVVLEKTLESPSDCKQMKPVNSKGNPPWIFIGRVDAEAEAPILWSPDVKSQLIGKDPDAGKDWVQEEKTATEDEIVGCHHQLNGHEFEPVPGDGEGQGSLVHGAAESDMTEPLKSNNCLDSFGCCIFLSQVSSPPSSSLKKKKKLFIFYWNIAHEQCCDSFRWTAKGLSLTYTCIRSPLVSPPIQAAT